MLAIIEACNEWQYYVEGTTKQIDIIMDYANLQKFLIDKQLNKKETQ